MEKKRRTFNASESKYSSFVKKKWRSNGKSIEGNGVERDEISSKFFESDVNS
jgi:hypothetical protein